MAFFVLFKTDNHLLLTTKCMMMQYQSQDVLNADFPELDMQMPGHHS
jgi:hypothetical protein